MHNQKKINVFFKLQTHLRTFILQEVEQMERARKSKRIHKPNLEKSIETLDSFILTTDADAAEISVRHFTFETNLQVYLVY